VAAIAPCETGEPAAPAVATAGGAN
jgi:hypothetical protein